MKIALVADSHDNLNAIQRALDRFSEIKVAAVLHAGDFVAPFAVKPFMNPAWEFHGIYGNNDGERAGIASLGGSISDSPLVVGIGSVRVGLVHDRAEWDGQECDLLVFGHTHKCFYSAEGPCLEINPGELGGWLSGKSTAAIYDCETADAEFIAI